ncbi:hypothetical protein B0H17DRAFT_1042513 [Mycena rosella]|uniref:BZIP domain-containing protein n=1 Tax=Mycena rosella TaxID=1033263 RepID=A0AAD7E1R6_MYCRO|nr:hypothetical protein B0H17DRAFT_1042513 [Mycena rosella]
MNGQSQDATNLLVHDPTSPASRTSRKRKTPPTNPEPNNTLPNLTHIINPMGSLPPNYQYSADFSPGALSSSKRAEQNRKAQRAFRERRDQSVAPLLDRIDSR